MSQIRSQRSPEDLRSPRGFRLRHVLPEPWTVLVAAIALLFSIPVLVVLANIFAPAGEIWQHLAATVLPRYIRNSFALMVGVGIGTATIGVATAWLVSLCRFPGQRVFEWALLLPIAAPAYVLAYTYTDMFDVAGPVQSWLRATFDLQVGEYWFPDVRSLEGAIFLLTLVLYPYVYLPTRLAFLERSRSLLEASLSLGCGPWRTFWRVALPLARPAIAGGVALALMETLNDFGTVDFFGVDTFTTGIFRTWNAMGERAAAAQLAAVLMMFIFGILLLERWTRGRTGYHQTRVNRMLPPSYTLAGVRAGLAWLACTLPVFFGFLLPGTALLYWTIAQVGSGLNRRFLDYLFNTVFLAAVSAGLAIAIGLLMAYGVRLVGSTPMRLAARLAAMGYAVPGSVIAVGILLPAGWLVHTVDVWLQSLFGVSTGWVLIGSVPLLIFAYLVRFMAVSFNTLEASLLRIQPSLDDAARSLGYGPLRTLQKVHAPLMTGGLLTAAMLVFVDVVKELPATLVLQPHNFQTMAMRVHRLASDERLAQAAPGSLAILVVGMIPAIFLIVTVLRSRPAVATEVKAERKDDLLE